MPEDQVYPSITFKRSETADELGTVVEKTNYNFDQIAMFSDLVKPRKVEQGERGIPGATGIGLPGEKGERGSVIHYSGISIPDSAPVSDPEHLVNDTVIDSVPKFMRVVEDGLGNKYYELQINLAAILSTDYLINQYDYLTGSGTAITTYIQRNWSGSPSPGDPGSENLTLVKRVDDNISEFYRLMVGTDRYLNDPTDISLYLANILPEDGIDANDLSLPQYSQIGLKYRPNATSNLTVNTVFVKYHESGNKWVYSLINSGVGMYAEYDTIDPLQNSVYLRGRKVKMIGNTANINPSNIINYLEVDVDTIGDITMSSNADFAIESDTALNLNAPIISLNATNIDVISNNVVFDATNIFVDSEFTIAVDKAITIERSGVGNRFFAGRIGATSDAIYLGNADDELRIYGDRVVVNTPIIPAYGIESDVGLAMLSYLGSAVILGDVTGSVQIATAANDIIHNRASVPYIVWDEYNMGAGGGLDADTVDTLHADQFIRSDVDDDFIGTLNYSPGTGDIIAIGGATFVSRNSAGGAIIGANQGTALVAGGARVAVATNVNMVDPDAHVGAGDAVFLYSNLDAGWASRHTVEFRNTGQMYVDGSLVWHAANDGAGTGLDADLLDGFQGAQYLRSDVDDTMTGVLTITQNIRHNTPTGAVVSFGAKSFIRRTTSGGAASIGADESLILSSGEAQAIIEANVTLTSENIEIGSDNYIKFYTGLQSGWGSRKEMLFNTAGELFVDNYRVLRTDDEGHGNGIDADTLDGQHGSYYRNASVLNAGTVNLNRLPGRLVTKRVTIGFQDYEYIGYDESDYYIDITGQYNDDPLYENLFTVPARSKIVHTVLRVTRTIDMDAPFVSMLVMVGHAADPDDYIPWLEIDVLNEYAETDHQPYNLGSRTVRLTAQIHTYGGAEWMDMTEGQWELCMSYIQYS